MASETATTFRLCDKKPKQHWRYKCVPEPQQEIAKLREYKENKCTAILQMTKFPSNTLVSAGGLINTVLEAYDNHHNLIIRPDDIWAAIMTQFSMYINAHAEEFRGKFVDFKGQKILTVDMSGSLRNARYDKCVKLFNKEIDKNLIDPEVKKWILPNFTTTTDNDVVAIGVVFMATMKKYFKYRLCMCGIPSVTLEGTIDDWKNVHGRLEKLKEYKLEKWYDMLEPVLQQFVNVKEGKIDLDFWQRIAHHERLGSGGGNWITGWITVFGAFDKDGKWQGMVSESNFLGEKVDTKLHKWLRISSGDIPPGIVEVDVEITDGVGKYNSVMIAGNMGAEIKNNGATLQPTLGWVIALKPDGGKGQKRRKFV